jgi:hypothetical protein
MTIINNNPELEGRKYVGLYYTAAITLAIAGILHLMLAPSNLRFNLGEGLLFTVGGVAQIFWIIPMIRRYGHIWYSIGIAGNFAFFAIWLITRFPGNPITGRGERRIDTIELITEAAQIAFIVLAIVILAVESRKAKREAGGKINATIASNTSSSDSFERRMDNNNNNNKSLMILGGIVVALIFSSLFLLSSLMARRGDLSSDDGGRLGGRGGPRQFGGGNGQRFGESFQSERGLGGEGGMAIQQQLPPTA